jgi:hypothetical protein
MAERGIVMPKRSSERNGEPPRKKLAMHECSNNNKNKNKIKRTTCNLITVN